METGKNTETGKFTKGNQYGEGRKRGSHDKLTYIIQFTSPEERGVLVRNTFERALAGDTSCVKMIWDCFPNTPYERYVEHVALQNINTEEEIDQAMQDTLSLVGAGELSLDDGIDVAILIEKRGTMILKNEIKELDKEEMRDKNI